MSSSKNESTPVEASVLFKSEATTRIYRLNRDKQLNALNHEMITSLTDKLTTWKDSELTRVIIGIGGDKAFCAGGDVKQLILDLKAGKSTALAFFKDEFQLNWLLARLGKPYISVMDGVTMGGGCGLALPAPLRIATPKTHFAMPETKIGYAPDVGVNYYLAQLDGYIGAWLAITGQDIYGRAVYELGLATHFVDPGSLQRLLEEVSQLVHPSLALISTVISASAPPLGMSSEVNSKSNPDGSTAIKGEIREFLDRTFSSKSIKEIYQKLSSAEQDEALSDNVKAWAKEQLGFMDMRSPTGMAVALEGYRRARAIKRLDITLKNDMAMATAFSGPKRASEDFITGVTAVLVNRSKARPEWSPSSITDPELEPQQIIKSFFDTKPPSPSDRKSTLDLSPRSTSKVRDGADSTWGKFRKYGLPSEAEVSAQVSGSAPGSGAFKITKQELVERILDIRGETAGVRASEIAQWTEGMVDRLCTVKGDGYLDWKRETSTEEKST